MSQQGVIGSSGISGLGLLNNLESINLINSYRAYLKKGKTVESGNAVTLFDLKSNKNFNDDTSGDDPPPNSDTYIGFNGSTDRLTASGEGVSPGDWSWIHKGNTPGIIVCWLKMPDTRSAITSILGNANYSSTTKGFNFGLENRAGVGTNAFRFYDSGISGGYTNLIVNNFWPLDGQFHQVLIRLYSYEEVGQPARRVYLNGVSKGTSNWIAAPTQDPATYNLRLGGAVSFFANVEVRRIDICQGDITDGDLNKIFAMNYFD